MPETPLKWWKPHSVLSCCRGSQVKLPVFSTGSPCRCSGVFRNARDSAEVVETAFCTFVLSRIAGEIASILDGIPLSVQRRFPELENRHVDFLKRDIIKAMNKAAALDELIPGLLSEYIEQSG
ncbi:terminase small subunit [Escherichia coli]|uniref:terminase small subunit n=1 Tax=Escherichia coli TaxID=562 RepID=UPI003D9F26AE